MTREDVVNSYGYKVAKASVNYSQKYAKDDELQGIVMDAFEQGARWADKNPHWISVKEKLPEVGQSCIILIDRKALQGMPRIRSAVYAPNVMMQQEGFAYNRMSKKHHITHWMHLPQPPSSSEFPNNSKKGGEE